MKRIKYHYNPESCSYEPVRLQAGVLLRRLLLYMFIIVGGAVGLNSIYHHVYLSMKETHALEKENHALKQRYVLLQKDVEALDKHMQALQKQDDKIYRTMLQVAPISSSIRQAGVGGSERYAKVFEINDKTEDFVIGLFKKVDQMKKQAEVQASSYRDLFLLAKRKDLKNAAMPAIQPISNKELYRLSSGYGRRIDPIYKTSKMHWGIDFSAPKGTPIYATGDGVVRLAKRRGDGYGNRIVIDHGFGYETLYGHLSQFNVKHGERVKRGDPIGFVGSTGKSTSPHLHYEVHYKGQKINPINYFFQDITEKEYAELLQRGSVENQSLD